MFKSIRVCRWFDQSIVNSIQILASEEVTYIIDGTYTVYKIQNQRIVKKVSIGNFFVQDFPFYSSDIIAGYIRDGSLILLNWKKQVRLEKKKQHR
jgi:hypothetical protein